ncbi:LOW QUALITY PROTEIN: hypothetical protein PHMEG_00030573 [Phytophthora megakarya]|uniref:Reverse transcriptase n=1 Tax=Phytophthora megakarya TaxID=4795 RepID=A0A225V0R6_9STRA|nr:LOW QUALITY PROTEIN: hypothetical protein PHMEG_00030573 [Phytophthora megakarya]
MPLRSDQQQEDATLRLVVPSTMIQEVLKEAIKGSLGLSTDASKSRPTIRGYSPGNVLAERPFQVVSMDFVIPSPKSRRGNTALLLFQCAFTGYVMGKSMADTTALKVAQAFEECVYRRFGAPSLIRHDRDPRFMSESTLKAMSSSLKRGLGRQSDVLAWRRDVNRQQEIALKMAKEYQATEKARRARKHNKSLRGRERGTALETDRTLTRTDERSATGAVTEDSDTNATAATRSLFEVGSRVWLYMERVKPGQTRKLAHRWHVPFRVKRKVEAFAYELELPDRSGYRFHPVVHVSRLKMVDEFGDRPSARLTRDVNEATRLDFDDELRIVGNQIVLRVNLKSKQYWMIGLLCPLALNEPEFKVKWVGYDDPTWEPASNLSCGVLLYDYPREKRRDRRLQMVQVADED